MRVNGDIVMILLLVSLSIIMPLIVAYSGEIQELLFQ